MKYFAHSGKKHDKSDWQSLREHLEKVAEKSQEFANKFGAGDWGCALGVLHDAGKACNEFQRRLENNSIRVDHSTYGARLAREESPSLGVLLAYAIAGHHGGLPNGGEQEGMLHHRLLYKTISQNTERLSEIKLPKNLEIPFPVEEQFSGFSIAFFVRMIFSCLVDADFLDTERVMNTGQHESRIRLHEEQIPVSALQTCLHAYMDTEFKYSEPTHLNIIRNEIFRQCDAAAQKSPGVFSLTVPTGGGKTTASLAFALNHANKNKLEKVIYAVPFTSIIEQNADTFKKALGKNNVLEHHCNYKQDDHPENAGYERARGLATENWDAPVIVTTNVQFFESLFANRPSHCRKLHRIANSVIILDEPQAIPTPLMTACMTALKELVEHYSCTVVLCTATQPALDVEGGPQTSFPEITEICDDPEQLFSSLKRVRVSFTGRLSNQELAEKLSAENCVLCIVSTKRQARETFALLNKNSGVFHLSTSMHPEHRRATLKSIRKRLAARKTCRVVSTTLVEAGIDISFPVVFRAMAGLDSVAQAAGRCNRNGETPELGRVYVFEEEHPPRMPWLKRCAAKTREVCRTGGFDDVLAPAAIRRYFELLYEIEDLDTKRIMDLANPRLNKDFVFKFKELAHKFKFIDDDTVGIIVLHNLKAKKLVQELRETSKPRNVLRSLQQYSVSVRARELQELERVGAVEIIDGKYPLLANQSAYCMRVGLNLEGAAIWAPTSLNFDH